MADVPSRGSFACTVVQALCRAFALFAGGVLVFRNQPELFVL
jgi:hypothetical protein